MPPNEASRHTHKVIILCGGLGTRLREETEYRPKPMVRIGGQPIIWHIMKTYARHGFKDFVLCLGYRGRSSRTTSGTTSGTAAKNEWKKYSRASKKRFMARTLEEIISECNNAGLPWEQLLREEMQNWSRGDLWRAINEWTFCGAPKTLIYNAMDRLRIWDGGHFKNGLKIMRKLGFNCFLKYYFDHYKTRRL